MTHKLNDLQKLELELEEVDELINLCNKVLDENTESESSLELLKIDIIELHKRKAEVIIKLNKHCSCATKCKVCKCKNK